jgi:hypothetical protein
MAPRLVSVRQPFVFKSRRSVVVILPNEHAQKFNLHPLGRPVRLWIGDDAAFDLQYWA